MVATLRDASVSLILFGDFAVSHPLASLLRALARFVAGASASAFNEVPSGANAVGLARVGVMPQAQGMDAAQMLARPRKALLVYQAEAQDTTLPALFERARAAATFNVHLGAFACEAVRRHAHVILPIGLPPEIDGSFVNLDGRVQSFGAGAKLPGDARPGWRVLRALGAALDLPGFEFVDLAGLRASMPALESAPSLATRGIAVRRPDVEGFVRIATVPIYRSDAVVRRSPALQATPLARTPRVGLHPGDAQALGVDDGSLLRISDGTAEVILPVERSAAVPHGAAWIESGHPETAALGPSGSRLSLQKA